MQAVGMSFGFDEHAHLGLCPARVGVGIGVEAGVEGGVAAEGMMT